MSELAEQADADMAEDLTGAAVLAEAVRREASGTISFEDETYSVEVGLTFEKNGEHGEGEYYRVRSTVRPGICQGQVSSRRFDDRGEAEDAFDEQVEKWDLDENEREASGEDGEPDSASVLGALRRQIIGGGGGE